MTYRTPARPLDHSPLELEPFPRWRGRLCPVCFWLWSEDRDQCSSCEVTAETLAARSPPGPEPIREPEPGSWLDTLLKKRRQR